MNWKRSIAGLAAMLIAAAAVRAQEPADSVELRAAALRQARYLKSIYKTDAAIETLSPFVTSGRLDEEVLSELADCHFQSGDYQTAAGTYVLLSSIAPDNLLYKVRQMQTAYRLKAFEQSAQAGKAILQRDSIPAIAELVGDSFNQMLQPDSALVYYNLTLAVKPLSENAVSKASKILLERKDYDGALGLAEAFLRLSPDNVTVAPVKGLALYSKEDYAGAIEVFERQKEVGNDSYSVHFYLGQSYWRTKDPDRAKEELLAAWQIDSSDVNLAYSIAAMYSDFFYPPKKYTLPWLDKAYEMVQPSPVLMGQIHKTYALEYYKMQDLDNAIEHYKEAYRYNPSYISAVSTIAYCYEQKKDYRQAKDWFERYLKLAKPGSKGYTFAEKELQYINAELFMEE
jgi:tetratricopeptide (TPR) repeat protein